MPAKDFGPLEIIAVAFNICQAWAAIGAALALGVAHGGAFTLIYGLILIFVVYIIIALSAAELATQYPTAGGQYHWTAVIAPKGLKNQLSYACGCINMMGWITLVTGAVVIPAQIICGIIKFFEPSYVIQRWHVFLLYQAISLFGLTYNAFALRKAPWTHNLGFILSVGAFLVTTITCLGIAKPKQSATSIWTKFENETGWQSSGIAFLTGLANINFGFAGLDGAIHLAEESKNASTTVPWALISAVLMSFVTTFFFLVATLYCVHDFNAVINTTTNVPLYEIWYQATRSKVAAALFIAVIGLLLTFTTIAVQQTSSRLTWSFARDEGLLGARYIKLIHPRLGVPVWALVFNGIRVFVIGCVYLCSTTAFNAIVSPGIILEQISFAIPAALLLWQRRDPELLSKKRSLGRFGWIANGVTVGWAFIELIFYSFPAEMPVTRSNMNYTCAVLGGMGLFIFINWKIHGVRHYKGPNIDCLNLES